MQQPGLEEPLFPVHGSTSSATPRLPRDIAQRGLLGHLGCQCWSGQRSGQPACHEWYAAHEWHGSGGHACAASHGGPAAAATGGAPVKCGVPRVTAKPRHCELNQDGQLQSSGRAYKLNWWRHFTSLIQSATGAPQQQQQQHIPVPCK